MSAIDLPIQNRLLRRLSETDRLLLGPLERVTLEIRQPIEVPGEPVVHAYFPEDGVASVVFGAQSSESTEFGLIGREGVTALAAIHGDEASPLSIFIQLDGSALRCSMSGFEKLMSASVSGRALMLRYARAFSLQIASTAVTNGRGRLEERLARWFLMVGDRAGSTFHITHEFISVMLAVRRSGVTLAIQSLEARGLVQANRGSIRIADRQGLIEAAAGLYGLAEREYERLVGPIDE